MWVNKTTPQICHSDRSKAEWRNPPRWIMNHHKIKQATREDSSTHIRSLGMTCRYVIPVNRTGYNRNVAGGRLPPLHTQPLCAHCYYNGKRRTAPHPPPMAVPLPRRGRSCVVPFNRTGCIRNVAGGRLPPLHTQPLCAYCSYNGKRRTAPHPPPMAVPLPRRGRSCGVPFNRTGCSRDVAGG